MSILFGLIAALSWGTGDFFARNTTRRIGAYRTIFYMQFLGFAVLGAYLVLTGELQILITRTTWQPWLWGGVVAVLNVFSSLAFFRALEVGKLVLVSPITASYAAVTVALSLLSGETLTPLHLLAIALVLVGMITASISSDVQTQAEAQAVRRGTVPLLDSFHGVGWALLAALGYGTTFWVQGIFVVPDLGAVAPVWLVRVGSPILLALCAFPLRLSLKLPPRRQDHGWIIGLSVLDTVAYLAFSIGIALGEVAIVTMLSSLYTVVTVVLAGLVLREHLRLSQWCGICVVFVGIALVNL